MNLLWWPWFGKGGAAPVVPEYHPVGDSPALEIRRSRRRRQQQEIEEDEILFLLSCL